MKTRFKVFLLFSLLLYFVSCTARVSQNQTSTYIDITPIEAREKIQKAKNVLLLDVRTKEEFSEEHIKNALNIPVQELEKRLDELKKYKNFEIIVYCRSGARSRRASEILVKNGFKFVYNLSGGIIEWKKQFEVEK
ncbi:rhodanese-like domain-containing protein [Candidatus Kryptobacter tengchongensis]|uniref:Rhodanese-related sulfurtransferase n=1 Tax=Kryptobacter tengchongensis TaxID=1643429 RepID=A0A656D7T5_KRYT1|nr:rhodanese-like domain-containing protein [Candidatus Kryptobacter tengchongensis]CUT00812.1 Rhodanese-related sulfurtransferase [Candidatus Kryptobacter tengchongensis]